MAYTSNDRLPRIRAQAVRMVRSGKSTREVARHLGYSQSAVVKWMKKARIVVGARIETRSSRPLSHPNALSQEIIARIIKKRSECKRCSEVVHEHLRRDGVDVSLSSVKRVLRRYSMLKTRSKWKRKRKYLPHPGILKPGDLVQFDTVHLLDATGRRYVYTALDVFSRYGFAMVSDKANTRESIRFFKKVKSRFLIQVLQTDNGPEFGLFFSDAVRRSGVSHHRIHPRSPNENGHLERFNRTIQEETLAQGFSLSSDGISKFLAYYNEKRLHMGINFKTPQEMLEVSPRC